MGKRVLTKPPACCACGQEIPFKLKHDLRDYDWVPGAEIHVDLILGALKELQEIAHADEERRRENWKEM